MNAYRLAIALSLMSTLAACDGDRVLNSLVKQSTNHDLAAVGVGDAAPSVNETPDSEQVPPDVSSEQPHKPAYGEDGYTGPLPCPESRFGSLTCGDDGAWHWLNPDFSWRT